MSQTLSNKIKLTSSECVRENQEFGFKIHHCRPENETYHLLVTEGLQSYEQDVNEDNKDLKRIELYMLLPDYWKLEKITWPIDWLERIAALPQKNKTWFGHGDTIPAGNPPEELDEKLKANHFILSRPMQLEDVLTGNNWKDSEFQFLAVIPIFQKELDYKLRNSHTMLFKKFAKKNTTEELDLFRLSTCGKRPLGLF